MGFIAGKLSIYNIALCREIF